VLDMTADENGRSLAGRLLWRFPGCTGLRHRRDGQPPHDDEYGQEQQHDVDG
jgi:hypothetical protein